MTRPRAKRSIEGPAWGAMDGWEAWMVVRATGREAGAWRGVYAYRDDALLAATKHDTVIRVQIREEPKHLHSWAIGHDGRLHVCRCGEPYKGKRPHHG